LKFERVNVRDDNEKEL